MKQEYKAITIFVCFFLISSIYYVRWIKEGPIVGNNGLFSVYNGSDIDTGLTQGQVQNRLSQSYVGGSSVTLQSPLAQSEISGNAAIQNLPSQTDTSGNMNLQDRKAQPGPFDVILSAYKHSGSSVTGRVLSEREDAFYVYEPLWKLLRDSFYKGPNLRCLDAGKYCINLTKESSGKTDHTGDDEYKTPNYRGKVMRKYTHGINRVLNETLNYLQSIFECSFHQYLQYFKDPKTNKLLDGPHAMVYFKGGKWGPFKSCISRSREPYEGCWREAESICKAAKHRVIKLLRMSLDNLASLLRSNRRLKLIYLYRDPRGIHNSQSGTTRNISKSDEQFNKTLQRVESMCDRMQWDINAGKVLKANFPERVKFIQYENLGNLTEIGKDLNAFLGMSYSHRNHQKLIQMSYRNGTKGFHPFNYRTSLSWDVVSLFETECAEVLDQLGYTRYRNETHLRDMSQSGFVKKNAL